MKHCILMSILVAVASILNTGCSNQETKAQAVLVQAISYSDGNAPSQAEKETALKLAAAKGFKPGNDTSSLSDREVVMVAGKILCDRILADFPSTKTALKAAELKQEINQRLNAIANQRIQSMYPSTY